MISYGFLLFSLLKAWISLRSPVCYGFLRIPTYGFLWISMDSYGVEVVWISYGFLWILMIPMYTYRLTTHPTPQGGGKHTTGGGTYPWDPYQCGGGRTPTLGHIFISRRLWEASAGEAVGRSPEGGMVSPTTVGNFG